MLEQNNTTLKNSDLRLCDETRSESLALIIIPTFNEAENIARLLNKLSELYQSSVDILVIDDNSPDGTIDIVHSMQQRIRGLQVIKREKKLGLGTAYITGFHYALDQGYRYVIEMDADYSHDPAEVSSFFDAIKEADLVIGSRYMNNTVNVVNWPLGRLILSKLASIYTQFITGMPVDDPTSGFKCFNAEVLRVLEYIVVHELVHLLERNHTDRFTALMDGFLPSWRVCRETLNSGLLAHEVWQY